MEFQQCGQRIVPVKLFSALIGGSAVVVMAALGVAVGHSPPVTRWRSRR